jgi:hypothetical protein
MDAMLQRYPEIIWTLWVEARSTMLIMFDDLIWRSLVTESGSRRGLRP